MGLMVKRRHCRHSNRWCLPVDVIENPAFRIFRLPQNGHHIFLTPLQVIISIVPGLLVMKGYRVRLGTITILHSPLPDFCYIRSSFIKVSVCNSSFLILSESISITVEACSCRRISTRIYGFLLYPGTAYQATKYYIYLYNSLICGWYIDNCP